MLSTPLPTVPLVTQEYTLTYTPSKAQAVSLRPSATVDTRRNTVSVPIATVAEYAGETIATTIDLPFAVAKTTPITLRDAERNTVLIADSRNVKIVDSTRGIVTITGLDAVESDSLVIDVPTSPYVIKKLERDGATTPITVTTESLLTTPSGVLTQATITSQIVTQPVVPLWPDLIKQRVPQLEFKLRC